MKLYRNVTNVPELRQRVLKVVVIEKKEENLEDIFKDVQGEEVALEALSEISNMNLIKKVYKLNDIETEHIQAIDSICQIKL
ncbi:Kinase binding protein CGI-121 [Popillia japonica]|uniref:Kinase binding protein CGI-121 n=1 Tax=Popillia japonica TaxID=7064 RepID=A0AAW1KGF2_POPJA